MVSIGLNIDFVHDINESLRPYAPHVVIRTSRDYWSEKIEDVEMENETGGPDFTMSLDEMVGKGGKFYNVGINDPIPFEAKVKIGSLQSSYVCPSHHVQSS